MNPNPTIGGDLERWLQAEAPSQEPAHLREAIDDMARTTRQRPRWVATIRANTPPLPVPLVGHSTLRLTYLMVLLAFVLAALGAAIAGGLLRTNPSRPAEWVESGAMIEARDHHTATLLPDGKVLVTGGLGLATAELYDPGTRSWTATGRMNEAREGHTATLLRDGRVLVAGGNDLAPTGAAFSLASAELYDPVTGSWAKTGTMRVPRAVHSATLLSDGRVLVAGGISTGIGQRTDAELYDPGTGSWTKTGSLLEARSGHTATLLRDGRVLVAGGAEGRQFVTLPAAELYDASIGTWAAAGIMDPPNSVRNSDARLTATLLMDGMVLVTGDDEIDGATPSSADVFDPDSGTWTATGSMIGARDRHTATLLRDGKVLVTGGWDDIPNQGNGAVGTLSTAEVYDPLRRSWTTTAALGTQRALHTATLLADGRVLVAGGSFFPDRSGELASIEVYDPGSER